MTWSPGRSLQSFRHPRHSSLFLHSSHTFCLFHSPQAAAEKERAKNSYWNSKNHVKGRKGDVGGSEEEDTHDGNSYLRTEEWLKDVGHLTFAGANRDETRHVRDLCFLKTACVDALLDDRCRADMFEVWFVCEKVVPIPLSAGVALLRYVEEVGCFPPFPFPLQPFFAHINCLSYIYN